MREMATAAPGLFPPDAAIRQVAAEGALLLGGGRALLMQLAHPKVAAGVAEHSDFAADPMSRLFRTLATTYTIVFGSADDAERVAAAVRRVHDRVTGPGYEANDPDLLMWVHATLVDTSLVTHRRFMGGLDRPTAEAFYQDSKRIAELYGCPIERQPPDLAAFELYLRTTLRSLEVTPTARRLARQVLHARLPLPLSIGLPAARHVTIALLPGVLRRRYGYSYGPAQRSAVAAAAAASRVVVPRLPRAAREAPVRYFARGAVPGR